MGLRDLSLLNFLSLSLVTFSFLHYQHFLFVITVQVCNLLFWPPNLVWQRHHLASTVRGAELQPGIAFSKAYRFKALCQGGCRVALLGSWAGPLQVVCRTPRSCGNQPPGRRKQLRWWERAMRVPSTFWLSSITWLPSLSPPTGVGCERGSLGRKTVVTGRGACSAHSAPTDQTAHARGACHTQYPRPIVWPSWLKCCGVSGLGRGVNYAKDLCLTLQASSRGNPPGASGGWTRIPSIKKDQEDQEGQADPTQVLRPSPTKLFPAVRP